MFDVGQMDADLMSAAGLNLHIEQREFIEAFDKASTLSRLRPKLVRSYSIDAMQRSEGSRGGVAAEDLSRVLSKAAAARWTPHDSPGLGEDWRLETERALGAALVVEQNPIHIEMFAGVV